MTSIKSNGATTAAAAQQALPTTALASPYDGTTPTSALTGGTLR